MGRYVTIIRWTAEQAEELARRARAVRELKAPKEILAAVAKMKIISTAYSPSNFFNIVIFEVDDKDFVEANLVTVYYMNTCSMETYPVLSEADTLKLGDLTQNIFPERMWNYIIWEETSQSKKISQT